MSSEALISAPGAASLALRPSYRAIDRYAPNRAPCRIDLSDNTNRHGAPPAAIEAIRGAIGDSITRYPNLYAEQLKEAIGEYTGVSPVSVVTGCGSDDVLDSAIRAFAEPGDAIAFPAPTFPMVPIFARMNGLRPLAVPLTSALAVDIDALLATEARIIYVCSPNNPTGTVADRVGIERLIREAPGLLILDEAYIEYAGAGHTLRAATDGRLLVTRTLSKAFGLAGLRVGYAIGAPALVAEVEKSRGPYKVSAIGERAAIAALRDGQEWVRARVADDIAARRRLEQELLALGLEPIPSSANFVLVPIDGAERIARGMRASGVAVRPFPALPIVGDALRITVGPWSELEECLAALRAELERCAS